MRCVQARVEPIVIVDEGREGPEWLRFLHQRAEMAAKQNIVSPTEASTWREAIDRAAAGDVTSSA